VKSNDLQKNLFFFIVWQKTHEELEKHEWIYQIYKEELNIDLLTIWFSDYKDSSIIYDLILNVADQLKDHSQDESELKCK